MSTESNLFDLLKGLAGNRVYPDAAPFNTTKPYITYQQIGGQPINYIDNTLPDRKHGLFQINVWDESRSGAAVLVTQIESAMIGALTMTCRPSGGPVSQHEPDLNLYGYSQDFDIWSER